ncbi:SDR family NAD(P)-dependent oxidoreductase [Streptomyces sp. NPDC005498]|uniref:SDR family NAD(P)-dependent oxidoreductase n=1 Tax=Streptomyces sp. NPDC005498 TaxID=3364717 RepID=UPI0036C6217C
MLPTADYAREFIGKTALVTGGASGIGLATARRLAAGGAAVAVADYNEEGARTVAAELKAGGARALAVHLDVTDPESVRAAVEASVEDLGGLHLAVNNAGIGIRGQLTGDHSLDDWSRVIATNLDGVFYSLRYELPAILASGGGAVVNISSVMGTNGTPGQSAYVAAKHGVLGLTKAAALEYAAKGVRINAVAPGFIDTPILAAASAVYRERITAEHAVGRLGAAEEVAELTAFLLSDRASFVHGSCHLVDGGYSAH